MKTLAIWIASAGLLLAAGGARFAGPARADDLGDKVSHGAHAVGKTIVHGAKAVGHGGAKVYHDVASGVHRDLAHQSDSEHSKTLHLKKAAREHREATRESHVSHSQMHRAGDAASDVAR